MKVVTGTIHVPADMPVCTAGHVRIRVNDVTYIGASQPRVAEVVLDDVLIDPALAPIPFEVHLPDDVPDSTRLSLDVHVDVDGSGALSVGDLVNDAAVAVLTNGAPSDVAVAATPVR